MKTTTLCNRLMAAAVLSTLTIASVAPMVQGDGVTRANTRTVLQDSEDCNCDICNDSNGGQIAIALAGQAGVLLSCAAAGPFALACIFGTTIGTIFAVNSLDECPAFSEECVVPCFCEDKCTETKCESEGVSGRFGSVPTCTTTLDKGCVEECKNEKLELECEGQGLELVDGVEVDGTPIQVCALCGIDDAVDVPCAARMSDQQRDVCDAVWEATKDDRKCAVGIVITPDRLGIDQPPACPPGLTPVPRAPPDEDIIDCTGGTNVQPPPDS